MSGGKLRGRTPGTAKGNRQQDIKSNEVAERPSVTSLGL
jgi:hypothetical protein